MVRLIAPHKQILIQITKIWCKLFSYKVAVQISIIVLDMNQVILIRNRIL